MHRNKDWKLHLLIKWLLIHFEWITFNKLNHDAHSEVWSVIPPLFVVCDSNYFTLPGRGWWWNWASLVSACGGTSCAQIGKVTRATWKGRGLYLEAFMWLVQRIRWCSTLIRWHAVNHPFIRFINRISVYLFAGYFNGAPGEGVWR